jgi:hypothetical protein
MNLITYNPLTLQIADYVENCVRKGNEFRGADGKYFTSKLPGLEVKWTLDTTLPVIDPAPGEQTGWDKTADQMVESATPGATVTTPDHASWAEAVEKRADLADLTFDQLDTYINNNVVDLASAKVYLKKLSKVVLGMIKMMDHKA